MMRLMRELVVVILLAVASLQATAAPFSVRRLDQAWARDNSILSLYLHRLTIARF